MEYELSKHARDVLREREIDERWLQRVLDTPQRTEPDPVDPELEHRLGVIPQRGGRVLRVIIRLNVSPIRVVTVYFDRAMRGRL